MKILLDVSKLVNRTHCFHLLVVILVARQRPLPVSALDAVGGQVAELSTAFFDPRGYGGRLGRDLPLRLLVVEVPDLDGPVAVPGAPAGRLLDAVGALAPHAVGRRHLDGLRASLALLAAALGVPPLKVHRRRRQLLLCRRRINLCDLSLFRYRSFTQPATRRGKGLFASRHSRSLREEPVSRFSATLPPGGPPRSCGAGAAIGSDGASRLLIRARGSDTNLGQAQDSRPPSALMGWSPQGRSLLSATMALQCPRARRLRRGCGAAAAGIDSWILCERVSIFTLEFGTRRKTELRLLRSIATVPRRKRVCASATEAAASVSQHPTYLPVWHGCVMRPPSAGGRLVLAGLLLSSARRLQDARAGRARIP